nr:DUF4019 domain-containing protein [Altererythrobacter lutimaris]
MQDGFDALTTKEKDTLRLMLRGHDAKSMANHLELSVHTINERLRAARRKLGVTSSREAARILAERDQEIAKQSAYKPLGDAISSNPIDNGFAADAVSAAGNRKSLFPPIAIGGFVFMLVVLSALSLAIIGAQPDQNTFTSKAPDAIAESDASKEGAARSWLLLVDAGDWQASFDAAGKSFQEPNTLETWRSASEQARVPLGNAHRREMIEVTSVNAPPNGFEIVRFRTDFENRQEAIETVTLEREGASWKVVGYFIS